MAVGWDYEALKHDDKCNSKSNNNTAKYLARFITCISDSLPSSRAGMAIVVDRTSLDRLVPCRVHLRSHTSLNIVPLTTSIKIYSVSAALSRVGEYPCTLGIGSAEEQRWAIVATSLAKVLQSRQYHQDSDQQNCTASRHSPSTLKARLRSARRRASSMLIMLNYRSDIYTMEQKSMRLTSTALKYTRLGRYENVSWSRTCEVVANGKRWGSRRKSKMDAESKNGAESMRSKLSPSRIGALGSMPICVEEKYF